MGVKKIVLSKIASEVPRVETMVLNVNSYKAGIDHAIEVLENADGLVWYEACDFVEFQKKVTTPVNILTRKFTGDYHLQWLYSVQNSQELTGFKMEVFVNSGCSWAVLRGKFDNQWSWTQ